MADGAERLALVQAELQFELGPLHERVNALVAAEAFLTIAYTTAMGNATEWGTDFALVVAPALAVLGLLLALLSWAGVQATVRLVMEWTEARTRLLEDDPALAAARTVGLGARAGRAVADQRRSTLFFRAAPGLFAVLWTVLAVVALVLPR